VSRRTMPIPTHAANNAREDAEGRGQFGIHTASGVGSARGSAHLSVRVRPCRLEADAGHLIAKENAPSVRSTHHFANLDSVVRWWSVVRCKCSRPMRRIRWEPDRARSPMATARTAPRSALEPVVRYAADCPDTSGRTRSDHARRAAGICFELTSRPVVGIVL
jgi:hypothetical protein